MSSIMDKLITEEQFLRFLWEIEKARMAGNLGELGELNLIGLWEKAKNE